MSGEDLVLMRLEAEQCTLRYMNAAIAAATAPGYPVAEVNLSVTHVEERHVTGAFRVASLAFELLVSVRV